MAKYQLSRKSIKNRAGVADKLIAISDRAIQITKVDFGHGRDSGKRTSERQHELFSSGASPCDGYDILSNHQSGNALDVTAYDDNGKPSWDHAHYAMIAVAFYQAAQELGYKIQWGGMYQKTTVGNGITYGWDCPHFELID